MPKVEIVTTGVGGLVYIDGHRVNGVLDIQLPMGPDQIKPQIVLKLRASEIVQRAVTPKEFARFKDA